MITFPPTGGRCRACVKPSDTDQPCPVGSASCGVRARLPATGCCAIARASWVSWGDSSPGASSGAAVGTARPKARISSANGLVPRLSVRLAVIDSRYGLNTAVSLRTLPWKSE